MPVIKAFFRIHHAWVALAILGAFMMTDPSFAAKFVKPEEMHAKSQWVKAHLLSGAPPFSFTYDSHPSGELLASWPRETQTTKLDSARTRRVLRWTDPKTHLEVRCEIVEDADYPAVEWTAYFKNAGTSDSPILRDIQGLDARFERGAAGEFVLNGIKGDWCAAESYEPYRSVLGPGVSKRFAPANSGKSCDGPDGWPYFNLQEPDGGVMLAIGWPGQWRASFERDGGTGLTIRAGQELTHLSLHPGEEVRTPLIALLFWRGEDIVPAQNLWRRWYLARVLPKANGQPSAPLEQIQVDGGSVDAVKAVLDAGIQPDICWRDAGGGYSWYPSAGGPYSGNDSWLNTGTWKIDPAKYPKGFKPFSDWVHAHGMKFLLWFEPERVGDPRSWLGANHPEWMLPGTSHGALLNLGDSAALNWLIDHLDGMIKSQGIDWYREDMNGAGPLPAWRKHDAENRQGVTENLYVQGHLKLWDELVRRNPGLRIDSCASGGRRNDLESMRRAVPLLRSDFQFPDMKGVIEGNQGHTYGLSSWLPFQGSGVYSYDPYDYRSFYMAAFGTGGFSPETASAQKKAYDECRRVAPLMLGDYYPLTPYSLATDRWIAWQFDRPEKGDGMIQAFRRGECDDASMTFRLSGLDPHARYEIENFDREGATEASGEEMMKKGLTVEISEKRGSAVIVYRRKRETK